jgi:hypothetical protein
LAAVAAESESAELFYLVRIEQKEIANKLQKYRRRERASTSR